jgi:cyclin C
MESGTGAPETGAWKVSKTGLSKWPGEPISSHLSSLISSRFCLLSFNSLGHRFLINDTYRTDLCLIHPPWIIAIASLYLALVLHNQTRAKLTPSCKPSPNPASGGGGSKYPGAAQNKYVQFLAGLNVSLPEVATVAQEMVALYALWDQLGEGSAGEAAAAVAEAGMKEPSHEAKRRVTERELVQVLLNMRLERDLDRMHPNGRPAGEKRASE